MMLSIRLKKIIKQILLPAYHILNAFYRPVVKQYLFSRIDKVSRSTQLFFMTRFDFGTWLLLMHYAQCWSRERGPACIVVFIPNAHIVVGLAKFVCPDVQIIAFNNPLSRIIFSIFRRDLVQFYTLNPLYAFACCLWSHALVIFDMTFCRKKQENIASYVPPLDPILREKWPFSEEFRNAYLVIRKQYDYRRPIYQDMMRLSYAQQEKPKPPHPQILNALRIQTPHVVINLNCKNYHHKLRNNRRICYPERYNVVIDHLISKGFAVVLQGREEQPHLKPRKGLIEYFRSPYVSPENDFHLFAHSSFAILPKTGPEVFGPICNIPVLGLDYTELSAIIPKNRCRFFPKHVWDSKKQTLIHWKDLLKRPCFFDMGILSFEEEIEYIDMNEEELFKATDEFLCLLDKPTSAWLTYTEKQSEFKQMLHPAHIDLFDVTEVPCEAYLSSPKYKE